MKEAPDRKKLRREYLWRKRSAYGLTVFYGVLCVLLWAIIGLSLYLRKGHLHGLPLRDFLITMLVLVASAAWITPRFRRSAQAAKHSAIARMRHTWCKRC
jgi:hypothetical protein